MTKPEMKNRILRSTEKLLALAHLRALAVALFVGISANVLTGCATPQQKPATTAGTQIRTITLAQLERSLPPPPVHVAFDVDDTTLFTSAGFQWGTRTYGKEIVSAGVSVREEDLPTLEAKQKYREFWTRMNNDLDQYSVKKWIASELIRMHKARGDQIFSLPSESILASERLTELLKTNSIYLTSIPSFSPIAPRRHPLSSACRPS
jgi:acid phosphatase (class B)